MAYVRKTKSAAELSAIRSAAGKKGAATTKERGNFKGGRPKGIKSTSDPATTCTIHQLDNRYLDAMSNRFGVGKAACVRIALCQYRELHPELIIDAADESMMDSSMMEFHNFIVSRYDKAQ